MRLFGFGKKKEKAVSYYDGMHEDSQVKNTRFIVLGACCQNSTDTFANVKQAVAELGFLDEVLNIGDAVEIAKFGVIQTPALVLDNRVVSYGKLIKVEEAKKLIEKTGIKA